MPAGSAENVLQSLATLLNMAEEGGPWTKIRFKHGAAFSESGVVVPPFKKQPWEAKMFNINALRKIAGISLPEPRPDDLDD